MNSPTTLRAGYVCPWLDRATCDQCSHTMRPVAHHTGDGWTWGWECPECAHYMSQDAEDAWPFLSETAGPDDWRAAGFEVV